MALKEKENLLVGVIMGSFLPSPQKTELIEIVRNAAAKEREPETRADQIRAMSDEELADWLARTQIDNVSEALKIARVPWGESAGLKELTAKDCLEWLQEPVEEGAT